MKVKEIFHSIQGEGFHAGTPAVFVRFAGCNLWSGKEEHRQQAICRFCDTDFLGGENMSPEEIIDRASAYSAGVGTILVFTGGEPLLQLTEEILVLASRKFAKVCIETNGTIDLPVAHKQWLWVTVSPKHGSELVLTRADEVKVVWPQPFELDKLAAMDYRHLYLQPMFGVEGSEEITINECLRRPEWKLSVQSHKFLGIR